jgi:hypothetical protein
MSIARAVGEPSSAAPSAKNVGLITPAPKSQPQSQTEAQAVGLPYYHILDVKLKSPGLRGRQFFRREANEFVAFRLAVGGFAAFGATNYRGFFGGANIAGQPVPYRVGEAG